MQIHKLTTLNCSYHKDKHHTLNLRPYHTIIELKSVYNDEVHRILWYLRILMAAQLALSMATYVLLNVK